jgi:hypothetical protein
MNLIILDYIRKFDGKKTIKTNTYLWTYLGPPWRRGLVVIESAYRTEAPGF